MGCRSLLIAAFALATLSCSSVQRFHQSAPGLSDGAWRIGGFVGGIGESSDLAGVDDTTSSAGFDVGQVIGDSGEFGFRFSSTSFDDANADVTIGGLYGRYYLMNLYSVRPLLELSGGLAGVDYGTGDETGWALSAGGGLMWVLFDRLALELVLRQTYGDFEDGSDSSVSELTAGVSIFL